MKPAARLSTGLRTSGLRRSKAARAGLGVIASGLALLASYRLLAYC